MPRVTKKLYSSFRSINHKLSARSKSFVKVEISENENAPELDQIKDEVKELTNIAEENAEPTEGKDEEDERNPNEVEDEKLEQGRDMEDATGERVENVSESASAKQDENDDDTIVKKDDDEEEAADDVDAADDKAQEETEKEDDEGTITEMKETSDTPKDYDDEMKIEDAAGTASMEAEPEDKEDVKMDDEEKPSEEAEAAEETLDNSDLIEDAANDSTRQYMKVDNDQVDSQGPLCFCF